MMMMINNNNDNNDDDDDDDKKIKSASGNAIDKYEFLLELQLCLILCTHALKKWSTHCIAS